MSLLNELRQRKLVQWAVAYVAAAFALLQGVDIVAQHFEWPQSVSRFLIIAAVVGFFVTLLLAWYHGERGAQKVSGPELLLLALVLAIGGVVLWRFGPKPVRPAATAGSPTTAGNADRHSIAVLPFVNMSGDKDNEYFSDGISEEILNVLAEVPQLKVAARTSSFSFKDKHEEVPRIARELGVRMVLEGSVRKQADRVRITAQLIDANTGFHEWSQTYDRELKDIFKIQEDIARSIGDELKVRIGERSGGSAGPIGTTNLEAHDAYLRGLSLWAQRSEASLWAAKEAFEKAIAKDPNYAQAYAGLAFVYSVLPGYSARIGYDESYGQGRRAAEHALALDPASADAYAALGNIEDNARYPEVGIPLLDRAIALQPSLVTAHHWRGGALSNVGRLDEGLASLQRAHELDPRSLIVAVALAYTYYDMGRYEDALAACHPALAYAPDSVLCPETMGMIYLAQGKHDLARESFERWSKLEHGAGAGDVAALFDALEGRGDRKALAERLAGTPFRAWFEEGSGYLFTSFEIPALLVLLGEHDAALHYLAGAAEVADFDFDGTLYDPRLDPIRCDPRFAAVMASRGRHDVRADTVCKGGR